jgi:hypothetical protein
VNEKSTATTAALLFPTKGVESRNPKQAIATHNFLYLKPCLAEFTQKS